MKRRISFILFLIITIQSCSIFKNTNQNDDSKTKKIESNQDVIINLYKMSDYFVWRRGQNLNLFGEVINNSAHEIILIAPKINREFEPEAFKVEFSGDFKGTSCANSVGKPQYPTAENFWRIGPGEKKEFQILGTFYSLNYCNSELNISDSIEVFIQYIGYDYQYNKESYFIKNNYKAELTESEKKELLEDVESTIKRNYSNLSEAEKDKKRELFTKAYSKQKYQLNYTPEEQVAMIELFNKSFKKTIKSNTIKINIEK
jgi:hypothetical protein